MVAESGVMASSSDDEEFSVSPSIADLNDILDSLPAFTGHTHTHTHSLPPPRHRRDPQNLFRNNAG